MRFRSFDSMRVFNEVAARLSFTAAAEDLNLTKGAVSYQIAQLERELGFPLFIRQHRSISLTEKGARLWQTSQAAFTEMEREIATLREDASERITIGMATYFASRWLSPRLMTFMAAHPEIRLRLQPLIDLIDLRAENIDMAIRWGDGRWSDMEIEQLLPCPAFPTAGAEIATQVERLGLEQVMPGLTLLHDREGSTAWADWHTAAGLHYRPARDGLVIPDPNVRVEAIVNGQGVALYDDLVAAELSSGKLFRISSVELSDYGYHLAYPRNATRNPALQAFRDWIISETE